MAKKGSGKTGKRKKNSTGKRQENFALEVIAVAALALSLFMLLSLFGVGAFVGKEVKEFQLGLFGILGYIFPFVFFISYLFVIANRKNTLVKMKVGAGVLIYFLLAAFIHLFSGREFLGFEGLKEVYDSADFGGVFGAVISGYLSKVIGKIGSGIVLFSLIFVFYLFISGISFMDLLNSFSTLFYKKAKEDISRMVKERRERKEESEDKYDEFEAPYEDEYKYEEAAPEVKKERIFRGINLKDNDYVDVEERLKKYGSRKPEPTPIRQEEEIPEVTENERQEEPKYKPKPKPVQRKKEESKKEENKKPPKENLNFSTTEENRVNRAEDVFTGIIINSNAKKEAANESLDEELIDRVNNILSRKEELEEGLFTGKAQESSASTVSIMTEDEEGSFEKSEENSFVSPPLNTIAEEDFMPAADTENEDKAELPSGETVTETMTETVIEKQKYENDRANLSSGQRQISTSTGKVIETDAEKLNKKLEIARAEKYEKALVKRPDKDVVKKPYVFPPASLLKQVQNTKTVSDEEYKNTAIKLQQTLHNFGVSVRVTNISCGPVVTRYELSPEQGVKVSKIVALQDDIKLSLAANDIRIEAPIPGKSAVGIEVPNKENNVVYFRELIESREFRTENSSLAFAVGKDIAGQTVVTDIAKMPHLLIAGATGSGKSVCINTLIMSILYKYSPDEVKLIMVDPKVVELSVYNGIPHLLIPVVTDPKKAAAAINWAVVEMTERYKKFSEAGVRNLKGYNEKIDKAKLKGEPEGELEKMSQIIIIIDELADLMMVAQNEVEEAICRLAQLARACGIHLVIATQRPSVNVITGLIKANIPSRIAFAVTSGIDSRTILDSVGAEKLLGKGDMLFSPQGSPKPVRVQGAFISDNEVQNVVDFIKEQGHGQSYDLNTLEKIENGSSTLTGSTDSDVDELFVQAGRFIIDKEKASIGNLQRVFKIGFNRAARIMDQLCEAGVVGSEQGTKPRDILMDMETFEELYGN